MKKVFTLFIFLLITITACSSELTEDNALSVGTIAGPETELMEVAKKIAKEQFNLSLHIVEFTDYNIPNIAVDNGDIDANMFQHRPFLQASIQARGLHLTEIGQTFIFPMALYSKKIKSLADLKQGNSVAIPNDPSNEARALLLLQKAGLITLKKGIDINATVLDIIENPHGLIIKTLDAAQIPHALDDIELAAINTNYAVPVGLLPKKDGLFLEDTDSAYANIVVVNTANQNDPRFQQLLKALHSPEVIEAARKLFHGQVIIAW